VNPLDVPALETDVNFPSGPWTGFFLQWWKPGRHPMAIDLVFENGELWATGSDAVGPFTFQGDYDLADGKCRWVKQYLGKHRVTYSGNNEGEGIWGVWEIRFLAGLYQDQGVFHIWPQGMIPTEKAEATVQAYLAHLRSGQLRRGLRLGLIPVLFAAIVAIGPHWRTILSLVEHASRLWTGGSMP
jgi:hypothetical protein